MHIRRYGHAAYPLTLHLRNGHIALQKRRTATAAIRGGGERVEAAVPKEI